MQDHLSDRVVRCALVIWRDVDAGMIMRFEPQANILLEAAENAAERAYVPYSTHKRATALLLGDGSIVPGVRVENASFSLTIPALVNAFSTATALGLTDVLAIAMSDMFLPTDEAYIEAHPFGKFLRTTERLYTREDVVQLPDPSTLVNPFQRPMSGSSLEAGVLAARAISSRAYIPESRFPVGCLIELGDGRLIIGVNVEHPEWSFIICAERNAIGTAVTYGETDIKGFYLSCPSDEDATPCGACRQVMVELAPGATVWMDRGKRPVEESKAKDLLPGFFSGRQLRTSI